MTQAPALFDRRLLRRRRARHAGLMAKHDVLFVHVAEELASRLQSVLRSFPCAVDLGAHAGQLGRAIAALPSVGQTIYAEASEALAACCPGPSLVCDEELLPFADASLDLVVSGLALHLVNDLPGTLVQIRKALRPDGLFMAAMLGGRTLFELREVFLEAETEIEGGASPRVAPFADLREVGALLQRSRFALPVVDTETLTLIYPTPRALMEELRGMGASNALAARRRLPLSRATLARAEALYRERHGTDDGRVRATFEIVYLSGWAPDASQQQPLRPGSARTRLAEALGTREQAAGDKAPFRPQPQRDENSE